MACGMCSVPEDGEEEFGCIVKGECCDVLEAGTLFIDEIWLFSTCCVGILRRRLCRLQLRVLVALEGIEWAPAYKKQHLFGLGLLCLIDCVAHHGRDYGAFRSDGEGCEGQVGGPQ